MAQVLHGNLKIVAQMSHVRPNLHQTFRVDRLGHCLHKTHDANHAPKLSFPEKFGLQGARKEMDIYALAIVIAMCEVGPPFAFPILRLDLVFVLLNT